MFSDLLVFASYIPVCGLSESIPSEQYREIPKQICLVIKQYSQIVYAPSVALGAQRKPFVGDLVVPCAEAVRSTLSLLGLYQNRRWVLVIAGVKGVHLVYIFPSCEMPPLSLM